MPLAALAERLGAALREALVREGLYPREAEAIVATWKDSWFGEDGLRVLLQVIVQLRKKLGDDSGEPKHLLTVHGVGFRPVLRPAGGSLRIPQSAFAQATTGCTP